MTIEAATNKANEALRKIDELRSKLPDDPTKGFETPEDRSAWDAANRDYDDAQKEIEQLKNAESIRSRLNELDEQRRKVRESGGVQTDPNSPDYGRRAASVEDEALAFHAWGRRQAGLPISKRHKAACERTGVNPASRNLPLALDNQRLTALQSEFRSTHPQLQRQINPLEVSKRALTLSSTSGGEMVGRMLMPMFEAAMLSYSGVLQACRTIVTNTGATLDWPTVNDTSNAGVLLAINTQDAVNADPATSEVSFDAYKMTSKIVLVPNELIEDDEVGFINALPAMLGERIGRGMEGYLTTGTGSSQPNGVVTASTAGVTAASTSAVTADEVIDLQHSVDPAYRANGAFMAHDSILLALRKLKDDNGQYLWQSGLAMGRPDMLLGSPVYTNQKMASSQSASAKILLFGDFSKYVCRIVRGIRFIRLVERYADYDQVGFGAFMRFDGDLLNAGVAPVKHLKNAAS